MMSFELKQQIPDPELLLTLEPEELAGVLLPILKKQAGKDGKDGKISGYNFANNFRQMQEIYPRQFVPAVTRAIMEAWDWLITRGLLAHDAEGHGGDWVFLTRAAWRIEGPEAFEIFRKASLLSPKLLHPVIAEKAWPTLHPRQARYRGLLGVQRGGGCSSCGRRL
jgi:hypothetical protein